tara:strand:+ start:275 stop:760 length:486 start_codon:yes stop_codon:yes gene_type:complete
MADIPQPLLDAPIPGQSLTAEFGARPWQSPPQYATIEEALDYYIPRLQSDEVTAQLLDVLEMGIPVTVVANTMQLGSVMEGKHTVDVGMLALPVLTELIMLIADTAKIKYTTGLEDDSKLRGSLIDRAVEEFKQTTEPTEEPEDTVVKTEEQKPKGLMARN